MFLKKKGFLNDMRDHVVSALTSRSRVSRVGSLIIVHAVLINQFFKRNNVGRCTYEYFFRFFFLIIAFFFYYYLWTWSSGERDSRRSFTLELIFLSLVRILLFFIFRSARKKKKVVHAV